MDTRKKQCHNLKYVRQTFVFVHWRETRGKFMSEFDHLEKLLQELKVRKDQLFSKNFFCSPEKFKKEFYSKIEHKKQQEMDQHGS